MALRTRDMLAFLACTCLSFSAAMADAGQGLYAIAGDSGALYRACTADASLTLIGNTGVSQLGDLAL